MKKLMKTAAALAVCALVLLAVMPRAQGATVYFMAVNDTPLELNASTMPTVVGGTLYVPYTMLSASVTGVNLGVYATYSSVRNSVLVYSSSNQLIFDLQQERTYDLNGKEYAEQAIVRNSTVYLPIARVCSVFDELTWSLNNIEYGYLVRVKSSSVILGDEAFISAADNALRSALSRYQQENPPPAVSESPAVASSSPSVSPGVTPSGKPDDSGGGAGVYLAFTQTEDGTLDAVLDVLDAQGCPGLFFLTADQMEQQDDLVRRLVGCGHFVGFRFSGRDGQDAMEELERAKQLLAAIAHCRLAVVLGEGLDADAVTEMEQAGYVCWQTTTDGRELEGTAYNQASALARQLTGGESSRNYLLLDDGSKSVLSTVLSVLSQADYQFRAPVAPEL